MSIEHGAITRSSTDVKTAHAGPLEAKGRDLGRKGDEMRERLASGMHDKAQHLQERAGDAKGRIANRIYDGRERVSREVEAHPVRTLLWAAGAGAAIGLLLAGRSRRSGNPE